jgi:two-component system response regulator DesR
VLSPKSSGADIAEIANQLFLSPGTARNYLSLVIRKLDAANRF